MCRPTLFRHRRRRLDRRRAPRFVDADPVSYTIDAARLEAAITTRTRAIMPVHLYGQAADLDPILRSPSACKLGHRGCGASTGAKYRGRRVGALARAGCFSFYPGKNLGAYGEGGAIVTNDGELARRARMLRDHGSERKYTHEVIGYNFRLEGIQAAVLRVKLGYLDAWNERRRAHAACYRESLRELELELPQEMSYAHHVYHLYVMQTNERDALHAALARAGVQAGIHYPLPLHLQPAYASFGHRRGDFPVTERLAERVLSLPMFPELTEEQLRVVADACAQAMAAVA
ncbi:MAG: DegT/DnrJ/EryC1/StrS family aminotransferase [Pyrinomonadaceae bacterium]